MLQWSLPYISHDDMYPLPPEPPSPPLHPSRSSRSARLGSLCLMPLLSSLTSLQVPLRLYFCSSCWQAHCSPWEWCYWSLPGRHCQRLPEFEVVSLKMLAGPLPSFPSTQLHNFSLGAETNFTITLLVKNRNILSYSSADQKPGSGLTGSTSSCWQH